MKLYDSPRAPNPRRVRIFLAEKGVEVPVETVEIGKGAHRTDAFARINPLQRLPVLELDDGTPIAETMAICRYLEELHPEPNLFGRDARERALVGMWSRRMELGLLYAVGSVFRHSHPVMAPLEVPQVPEWAQANRPKVAELLVWLDGELASRPFIVGNRFTVADITALCAVDFMKPAKVAMPENLAHVQRWHSAVSARPGSVL